MNRLESLHEQLDNIKRFGISENPGDFQGTFLSRDIPALLAVTEAAVRMFNKGIPLEAGYGMRAGRYFCGFCGVEVPLEEGEIIPHKNDCPEAQLLAALAPLLEEEA